MADLLMTVTAPMFGWQNPGLDDLAPIDVGELQTLLDGLPPIPSDTEKLQVEHDLLSTMTASSPIQHVPASSDTASSCSGDSTCLDVDLSALSAVPASPLLLQPASPAPAAETRGCKAGKRSAPTTKATGRKRRRLITPSEKKPPAPRLVAPADLPPEQAEQWLSKVRRVKNRDASRVFRVRQAAYIQRLEGQVKEHESAVASLHQQLSALHAEQDRLVAERAKLRSLLRQRPAGNTLD